MKKIYVYEDKLFKESSVDLYVTHLLGLRIKYLTTKQDCLDWIVYSPYFLTDYTYTDRDQIIISYGLVKTYDNETIYYTDQHEFNKQINLSSSTKSFEWYDLNQAI